MQHAGWSIARVHRARIVAGALAFLAVVPPVLAQRAPAGALDRIRQAGRIRLGYRVDAQPFSYRDVGGNPAGYAVALCHKVADAIQTEVALARLSVEWVPVTVADQFAAVQQGRVDLLCGAASATLARRRDVAFSIAIFPGGIGALLRSDAASRLRDVLSGQKSNRPTWRASAGQLLQAQIFTVVAGTTAEGWLAGKLKEFQLTAKVTPVEAYDAGVRAVLERKANVFFGDRAILLDAVARSPSPGKLIVLDRFFTHEPVALALARGDEDLRLVVDRALSRLYGSAELQTLYLNAFGRPDESALTFFRWTALPD